LQSCSATARIEKLFPFAYVNPVTSRQQAA
jgi:hypothetical protein